MTYLIIGATGQLGGLAVEALLARGVDPGEILAAGRNTARLEALEARGVGTARVDLSDPATIAPVVAEGQQVLLVSTSEVGRRLAQHSALIDAAARAGAARVVYTSATEADTSTLPLAPEHKATEEHLLASGVRYTILRNNWYTENYRADLDRARDTGVLANSVATGRIASAARADFAQAAAVALTTEGHEDAVYELTGQTAWSFEELAELASRAFGHEVRYQALTSQEEAEALAAAGLDEATTGFVVALNGSIREGALATTTGDLTRLLGRTPTSVGDSLRQWYGRG